MKVEILCVAECPWRSDALRMVEDVLAAEGVMAEIHEVVVSDERAANELKFPGSPTIRIDGRDVAGAAEERQGFTLSCRLYPESRQSGLPPAELVHRAVVEAGQRGRM